MPVPINYLAVLTCAVASMIIGSVWYGPLFGKQWIKLSEMSPEKLQTAKAARMTKSYVLMFVGSLIMAYVLAHALIFASTYFKTGGVSAGLTAGFWNWLGFIAPVTLSSVLWDGKPWKLWIVNNGYQLINLLTMGLILSLWT